MYAVAHANSTESFMYVAHGHCEELYAQCLQRLYEPAPSRDVARLLMATFVWGVDIFVIALAVACAAWLAKLCWTMACIVQWWVSGGLTRAMVAEAIAGMFASVLPNEIDESDCDDSDQGNEGHDALDQHAIDATVSTFATLETAPPAQAGDRWLARPPCCVVCREDPVTHVYSPCGHACLCPRDARLWRSRLRARCPVCKACVQDCFRFFLP